MSDTELLLAISNLLDEKFSTFENNIKNNFNDLETEVKMIKTEVEKDLRPNIIALAENYLPSTKRY